MTARRETPLTRDQIFSAGLAIIDAEGLDALTMRRLAHDLGVEAMSLYHHVANKQELLDGVVELSLRAEAPSPPQPGTPWQDTVVAAVIAFRRALVTHPNVLPHMTARPPASREAVGAYIEGPVRFLLANGLPPHDAVELFEAVFALSFGHATLTTNYPAISSAEIPAITFTESSFERAVRTLVDAYSAG